MTELGSTSDPIVLIPGSVAALAEVMWQLQEYADALDTAGDGLARIDTDAGWRGEAADAFAEAYRPQPARWREAGDSFANAAAAIDRYASTLLWAQARAADAIDTYARGDLQTALARHGHDARLTRYRAADAAACRWGTRRPPQVPPFVDPGEAAREEARHLLEHAREQLRDAGDREARTIAAALGAAPEDPTFWESVGSAAADAGTWLWNGVQDVGVAVVNGAASFGNAMVQHPADTALMLGGIMLASISTLGEVGGIALDATGVGAVAGVPLNIVAAAGITTGVAMAATGAVSLAGHASTDSRVEVLESRATEPSPRSQGRVGTKTDRCKEHLTERDLDAARRELNGETVATKGDGTPWDHVAEVRDAQRGLVNRIEQLKRMLSDTRLSSEARGAAQSELSEASRLLDYSHQFVPPGP